MPTGRKWPNGRAKVPAKPTLRHAAKMQPVIGTMNLDRLRDCVRAAEITLTREEWYEMYTAAGNGLP